jgi:hypothetical protein
MTFYCGNGTTCMTLYYGNGTELHLMMMAILLLIALSFSLLKKFNNVLLKNNLPVSNACSIILGLH